jgi:hypothetical protein
MPKAGIYDYPSKDLETCVMMLKKGHDKLKSLSMVRDIFAGALDMSPKTGPFGMLVGAMVYYGLVNTGDGYVRYTDIAKTILFGEPNEVSKSKKQAVKRVQLFADIHARFGTRVTEEQLRLFLREKANVDIPDAPIQALEVSKLYNKVGYFLDYHDEETSPTMEDNGKMDRMVDSTDNLIEYEHYKLGEGVSITLPKDEAQRKKIWERTKNAMDIILGIVSQNNSGPKKDQKNQSNETTQFDTTFDPLK